MKCKSSHRVIFKLIQIFSFMVIIHNLSLPKFIKENTEKYNTSDLHFG